MRTKSEGERGRKRSLLFDTGIPIDITLNSQRADAKAGIYEDVRTNSIFFAFFSLTILHSSFLPSILTEESNLHWFLL